MDEDNIGGPIPGAEHAEPPPLEGDAPPDFQVTPEQPPARDESAKEPRPRTRPATLKKELENFFGGIAILVMATGDTYCADIIATQAEPLAIAWSDLAKKNDRVRAMIEMIVSGSAWGAVFATTAATIMPIAAHHGLYPKGFPMPFTFGVGPPPPPSQDVRAAEAEADKQPDK